MQNYLIRLAPDQFCGSQGYVAELSVKFQLQRFSMLSGGAAPRSARSLTLGVILRFRISDLRSRELALGSIPSDS